MKRFKMLIFLVVGALAGYFYYLFIGCKYGTCPITNNPYTSTFYGLLLGLGFYWAFFTDEKKKE
ncbi:hypothetical protein [Candidatus Thermokryptus mobilis]|nr:hypothetical protein [Candidatus Thermokryptus mobilis]